MFFALLANAQYVTGVSYEMRYNESNCLHEVWLVIDSGSASSTIFRTQASSQMSVVVPSECTVTIAERHNPQNANGQPNFWTISSVHPAPDIDPAHSYMGITPSLGTNSRYEPLSPGMEIHLYDLAVTPSINGPDGIRFYKNGEDPSALDGLSGDFSNGFTIGTPLQLYMGNNPQTYPSTYASLAGPKIIYEGYETEVAEISGGAWTNADPTIVTLNSDGTVEGLVAGEAVLTHTPASGCATSVSVQVVTIGDPEAVGVGTNTPHPSAVLDIESSDKGMLLPRMSAAQRLNIVSPAAGLVVYQNTGNQGIYFYNGSEWRLLDSSPASNSFSTGSGSSTNISRSVSNNENVAQTIHKQEELEQIVKEQTILIEQLLSQHK